MLNVDQLQQHYPNFDLNVSFTVEADEIVGLIGRNGAGKSTTFKAILNLLAPDAGNITLFDQPVTTLTPEAKARIGATFPESFFADSFTLQDIGRILQASYSGFVLATFFANCQAQHLPLNKPLKAFSTGMKAKAKLLVAMSHEADFLLLDEPTSGLDVLVRQEVLAMLQDYLDAKAGRAVLLSSHISTDLETLCDRILLLDAGQIRLAVTVDELQTHFGVLKLNAAQYAQVKTEHLLAAKPRAFGYQALTDQRQFYQENYPQLVIEPATLDDLLVLLTEEDVE
ncbi:MAG: ABC transporter ATP-binding protein [Lactobacillus sp.]|jgi:ABC-2 type transport system ATP-binding protein|nr:ABC transporter ATP-binding protein [Lactobacillus sp.]MCI2033300.1 ABC transporter ATP-binding protein [Lactobacillus sp.]